MSKNVFCGTKPDIDSSANQNSTNALELTTTVQLCGASCAQQSCHTEASARTHHCHRQMSVTLCRIDIHLELMIFEHTKTNAAKMLSPI